MKTAYIFHDAFNDQFSDWYPWMKSELEKLGVITTVLQFPTPAAQSYESWRAVMKNYLGTFDNETLFIGHGTGGAFALRLAEELSVKIRGMFLIASYAEPIGHVGYDRLNETFTNHDFQWNRILENIVSKRVIAGQDDPFVPFEITERLANNLHETPVIIPDGGHLNRASGFSQAVPLLQVIIETLRSIDKSISIETPLEPSLSNQQKVQERSAEISTEETATPMTLTEESGSPKKTRTMYADMSLLVNSHQGHVASSLLEKARNDVVEKKITSPISSQNIVYILGTIICFLGIGFVGWLIYEKTVVPTVQQIAETPSLIRAENHVRVALDNIPSFLLEKTIRDHLSSSSLTSASVLDIFYTKGTRRATFFETLEQLAISPLPETLKQVLLTNTVANDIYFMHGLLRLSESTGHFLVLRFNQYDQAFQLIRSWEPTLVRSIGLFMNIPEGVLRSRLTGDIFSDEIVFNKNIRVLREGESFVIGYFFLNEQSIVIIDNLESIPEILRRYANRQIY